MSVYSFSFAIIDPTQEDLIVDLLYENNCDDALFGVYNGQFELGFDREGETLIDAALSALRDLKDSGIGSQYQIFEPNHI